MGNTRAGNKIYIDSTGAAIAGANQPVKVSYILFTPNTANDEMVIRETASGPDIFYIRAAVAKNTQQFDFSFKPVVFNNGIYIQTLTSGAKAVFITTQAGD